MASSPQPIQKLHETQADVSNDDFDTFAFHPFQRCEPVGGFARFAKLVDTLRSEQVEKGAVNPLLVFSGHDYEGEAYGAANESTKNRRDLLTLFLLEDVSCLGNHDFDFGVGCLTKLTAACNFPWLLSNVYEKDTNQLLAEGKEYVIIERGGLKIGFVGLVERDWLDTIAQLPPVIYKDFVERGKQLAAFLRSPEGGSCDMVVALTHMRVPNDIRLAEEVPEIDLVFGGHDHFVHIDGSDVKHPTENHWEGHIRVVKSGCDFRVGVGFFEFLSKVQRYPVTSDLPEDPEIEAVVQNSIGDISSKLEKPIGYTTVVLEARSSVCRVAESNIGNFACDLMRHIYDADIGFACGGTIRSDSTYGPGVITIRDVLDIFPFEDPCVVIKLKGKDIIAGLENGVGALPKTEGRFPQVSGLKFTFDSSRPSGSRVLSVHLIEHHPDNQTCNVVPLDPEKEYKVTTRAYLAQGHDGFDAFKNGEYIVDAEDGMILSAVIRRFFTGMKVLSQFRTFHYRAKYLETEEEKLQAAVDAAKDASTKWRRLVQGSFRAKDYRSPVSSPAPKPKMLAAVDAITALAAKASSDTATTAGTAVTTSGLLLTVPDRKELNTTRSTTTAATSAAPVKKELTAYEKKRLPRISPVVEKRIVDVAVTKPGINGGV
ncbi:hypothetical protein HK102_000566 [Quaeritorhiza haematococci]|nr:hypothetical protein HK102_000566 [Quaeritorhiza haematococci]